MSSCIEFRRAKLAAPRRLPPATVAHARTCRRCAAFQRQVDELDRKLDELIMLPVPYGIEDRILLRCTRRPRLLGKVLAGAATILLSVTNGHWLREPSALALGRRMIAHVLSKPEIAGPQREISGALVADAFASVGAAVRARLGQVTLLDRCPDLDAGGTHLVVHTVYGRATLLLLPNTTTRTAKSIAERGRVAALLPAGKGVIGVVANSSAQAYLIGRLLLEAVEWQE